MQLMMTYRLRFRRYKDAGTQEDVGSLVMSQPYLLPGLHELPAGCDRVDLTCSARLINNETHKDGPGAEKTEWTFMIGKQVHSLHEWFRLGRADKDAHPLDDSLWIELANGMLVPFPKHAMMLYLEPVLGIHIPEAAPTVTVDS